MYKLLLIAFPQQVIEQSIEFIHNLYHPGCDFSPLLVINTRIARRSWGSKRLSTSLSFSNLSTKTVIEELSMSVRLPISFKVIPFSSCKQNRIKLCGIVIPYCSNRLLKCCRFFHGSPQVETNKGIQTIHKEYSSLHIQMRYLYLNHFIPYYKACMFIKQANFARNQHFGRYLVLIR